MSLNKLNILNYFLNFFKVRSFREINKEKVYKIISLLKPYDVGIPLVRIGSENDGGYLVPDILNEIKFCFSPGVGKSSSFEKHLEKFGISSFLADKSVDGPANQLNKFDFEKKNINSFDDKDKININTWIESKVDGNQISNSILQIDTDGYEYEIFLSLKESILSEIKIIVVEFHGLELSANEYFNNVLISTLEKINLYHTPVHIHPNNCCGLNKIDNINIPSVMEVTFLNNSLVNKKSKINYLPNVLDKKNVNKKKNIILDDYWYK